jgi:hypothetical protein
MTSRPALTDAAPPAAAKNRPIAARVNWWEVAALLALLAVALALRLWRLEGVPPGVHFDEAVDLKLAQDVAAGRWAIYFAEGWGREALYYYPAALWLKLVSSNLLALRLTAVSFGLGLLVSTYFLVRRWHSPLAAWLAVAWLGLAYWPLSAARFGVRHISLPLVLNLAVLAFWWAWDDDGRRRYGRYLLAGTLLGLTFYTYQPARFVPLLFVAFGLYLLIWQRAALLARWRPLLLLAGTAVLVALPLLIIVSTSLGQEVTERAFTIEPLTRLLQGNPDMVLQNIWATLKVFTVSGDPLESYNVPGRPIFVPAWTGVFFYAGVVLALWRWRRPYDAFLLLWLGVMLLPVMVLAAIPMAEAAQWLLWRGNWWPRVVVALGIGGVLAVTAVYTYRDYFFTWPATPGTDGPLNRSVTDIGFYLERTPDDTAVVISANTLEDTAPYIVSMVMDRRDVPLRWADTSQALGFPAQSDAMRLIITRDRWLDPALSEFVHFSSHALAEQERFTVYELSPPDWPLGGLSPVYGLPPGNPWTHPAALSPLALDYPYRFCGCASDPWGWVDLESVTPTAVAHPGQPLTILTTWRVLADGQPVSIATFMHLLNDQGDIVAQVDGLGYPPHTWHAGDRFVQAHALPLPADLPPGDYWLQLGLYRRDTGQRWPVVDGTDTAVADRLLLPLRVEAQP